MGIDLNGMAPKDLAKLKTDVEKALEKAESKVRADAMKAVEKAAKSFGFTLDELFGAPAPAKRAKRAKKGAPKSKGAPKYKNPGNPDQTWTGRGRKPNWVIAALDAGKSLDDMAI